MLCDDCQKEPACVHITKILNGQKIEKHLCEQCAANSGDAAISSSISNLFANKVSIHDFLKEMFHYSPSAEAAHKTEISCSQCGMTYQDFSRSGKLGCGTCYQTFRENLEPLIKRVHGTCGHTGKIPKRSGQSLDIKQRIKALRQELEALVVREEYEQAAKVRDEIRILEKTIVDKDDSPPASLAGDR
ncbi:MAG TPA: UvrB/UvrC motif-containing protein [Methylomusa anaerophila]|uniref:UVR domain-containing protein n=1 Tax=Methylomusa anaerophila TaxID=1930071 RepID=A0A348AJR9_9FIRM|nr:UvrB/UvrC motif-containing protein [Methylomusa anaerophila]BBB91317.1 hypothetical protein MAMMFC1_01995 [Methylomusa anaerophila]HML90508.1 UvrB/UvrC motif-containing protein [Methylomusa anaerophila]